MQSNPYHQSKQATPAARPSGLQAERSGAALKTRTLSPSRRAGQNRSDIDNIENQSKSMLDIESRASIIIMNDAALASKHVADVIEELQGNPEDVKFDDSDGDIEGR